MPASGLLRGCSSALLAVVAACSAAPAVAPAPTAIETGVPTAAPATASAAPTATTLPAMPALEAQLTGPVELALDREGNLYVTTCGFDAGQNVIDRIDSKGILDRIAGSGLLGFNDDGHAALDTDLQCPAGLAFAPDGLLYVSDHGNNRIRRIEPDLTVRTVAGSGQAGINLGSFSGDGGPATAATLQEPWGIAFDSKGNLYIADRDNDRVRRVGVDGTITTVAGNGMRGFGGDGGRATDAQLCGPQGVAIGARDSLFIADDCNDRVRMVDPGGVISTAAGTGVGGNTGDGGPATKARIDGPDGLAFDPDGNLYIATNPGLTIRRVTPYGRISTVAGIGISGVPEDGAKAAESRFPELYGLVFDASGSLYVADGNSAIWRIDPAGIVTRYAGAP
jgi:sugar lactone lactonase YvrE